MSAHETHVDDPVRVVDLHHEPVVIALDVEDHPIARDDAGASVLGLHLGRRIPIFLLDFPIPGEKWLSSIGMPLPKLPERPLRDDPHLSVYTAPKIVSSTTLPKREVVCQSPIPEVKREAHGFNAGTITPEDLGSDAVGTFTHLPAQAFQVILVSPELLEADQ